MQQRNLSIIVISAILFSFIPIQEKEKTELEKLNLKGKVKTAQKHTYKAKKEADKIIKGERTGLVSDYMGNQEYEIKVNEAGLLVEKINFNYSSKIESTETFEYDTKNRLTNHISLKPDGVKNFQYSYKYNEKGELFEQSSMYGSSATIYKNKFDDSGNKYETVIWSTTNGDFKTSKKTYKYDNKKNLIEESLYDQSNNILNKNKFVYDLKTNKIIELTNENEKAIVTKKQSYILDKGGNCKEESTYYYNNDGTFNSGSKTQFKYDKKDNLIEASEYTKDNILRKKTTYNSFNKTSEEITYLTDGKINTKTVWAYDAKGNLLEEKYFYGANEALNSQKQYSYDSNNNIIKYTVESFSNISFLKGKRTEESYYDSNNNCIKTIYYKDDVATQIMENEITYY